MAPFAYDLIHFVRNELENVSTGQHPTLTRAALHYSSANQSASVVMSACKFNLGSTLAYFDKTFLAEDGDYQRDMVFYSAARLIDPRFVACLNTLDVSVLLKSVPFLQKAVECTSDGHTVMAPDEALIKPLLDEFATYNLVSHELNAAVVTHYKESNIYKRLPGECDFSIAAFWRRQASALPAWAAFAKRVRLVQTSSASCERAIGTHERKIGETKRSALVDYQFYTTKLSFDNQVSEK